MRHEGFWSKTTWAFPDQSCCRPNAREGHVDLHFTVSIGHVEMSNAKVRRTKAEIYSATPLQSSMLRRHQRKTSLRLGSAIRSCHLLLRSGASPAEASPGDGSACTRGR